MYLELGDIIKIQAIESPRYHNNMFLINYLDQENITLTNIVNSDNTFSLTIKDNILSEKNIQGITLIKRHDRKGFALQNNLYNNVWIDIFFNNDTPFIITGLITNSEEDMIEVTIYADETKKLTSDVIYIDFAYKGIPRDLPIQNIKQRQPPSTSETTSDTYYTDFNDTILQKTLHIDNIIYHDEEKIDPIQITQLKSKDQRKFGLNVQINDLTDDLLSTLQFTSKNNLYNIQTIVEKYKFLYNEFVIKKGHNYFFDTWYNHSWLIPVIVNKPYLYTNDDSFNEDYDLIVHKTLKKSISEHINNITNNSNTIELLNSHLQYFYSISDYSQYSRNIFSFIPTETMSLILKNINSHTIHSDTISYDENKTPSISSKKTEIINNLPDERIHIQSVIFLSDLLYLKKSSSLPTTSIFHKTIIDSYPLYLYDSLTNDKYVTYNITNTNAYTNNIHEHLFKKNLFLKNAIPESSNFSTYISQVKPNLLLFINKVFSEIPINKLSFHSVLENLLVFSIKSQDINAQYMNDIFQTINSKILELKKYIINNKIDVPRVTKKQPDFYKEYGKHISQYNFNSSYISSSELMFNTTNHDNMTSFYLSILSSQSNIIDISKFNNTNQPLTFTLSKKCNIFYLAKQYHTIEQLYNDNEKNIYFDSKFDPTNYDLFSANDINNRKECIEKLISQYKFTKENAEYEYKSILDKKRLVLPGHFALLYQDSDFKTFKRNNKNSWELTTQFNGLSGTNIFCNIQKDCFHIKKNLCSDKSNKLKELEQNQKNNMQKLDEKYLLSKEQFQSFISNQYNNALKLLVQYSLLHKSQKMYQNNIIYNVSSSYTSEEIDYSPYYDTMQSILAIELPEQRNEYIIKFCNKCTRSANLSNKSENPYWRYCLKTNTKLIPTFYFELATAYIVSKNYNKVLANICRKQGTLSDDGDKIIDIYSGHKIKHIELTDDFGENDVIESSLISDISHTPQQVIIENYNNLLQEKYMKYIVNIISAITKNMYISLSIKSYDYIISNIAKTFTSKYLVEKRSKLEDKHLEAAETTDIMYLTLSYLFIEILCSIPTLNPQKQYPGCVKSFNGWPLDDISNRSALQYISCIAFKLKTNDLPWKVLKLKVKNTKPTQETIENKIKHYLDSYILRNLSVQKKINNKIKYLIKNPIVLKKEVTEKIKFLPPLETINISFTISKNFKNLSNIQLKSKFLFISILLYYQIQSPFYEQKNNSNNELFLEKIQKNYNTFYSIESTNTNITQSIQELNLINNLISHYTYLSSNLSTFNIHNPSVFVTINDNKINHILYYLNNQNIIDDDIGPVFDKLSSISLELKTLEYNVTLKLFKNFHKPEYDENNLLINKIINIVQSYGIDLNRRLFNKISTKIHNEKSIELNFTKPLPLYELDEYLQYQVTHYLSDFDDIFTDVLKRILDCINISISDNKLFAKNLTDLKDILSEHISIFTEGITTYIKENSSYKYEKKNSLCKFIEDFFADSFVTNSIWSKIKTTNEDEFNIFDSIVNESYLRSIQFIKNFLKFLLISPNIIKTHKDYDSIPWPNNWDLSSTHYGDIKNIYSREYSYFSKYYEAESEFSKVFSELLAVSKSIDSIIDNLNYNVIFDGDFIFLTMQFLTSYYIHKFIELAPRNSEFTSLFADYIYDILYKFGDKNVFKNTIMSIEHINSIVHKTKENEKDTITKRLQIMSKEQRRVDNEFKKYGLGFWSKGQDKHVRFYNKDNYDEENIHIHEQMASNDFISNLYKDIFFSDSNIDDVEAVDLSNIPEDDDVHSDNEDI